MLTSFHVRGFRCFRDMSLDGLSRVNLIVGNNGVGKSTLLEALQVWSSSPWSGAAKVLLSRQELRPHRGGNEIPFDFDRLFWATDSGGEAVAGLTLEAEGAPERSVVEMEIGWFKTEPGTGRDLWVGPTVSPAERHQVWRDVRVRLNRESSTDTCAGLSSLRWKNVYLLNEPADVIGPPVCRVDTRRALEVQELGRIWSETALTDRHQRLREALRLLVPTLEDVNVVSLGEDPRALARLRGASGPVPLASLGEGLVSLFTIAITALQASGGILLIDEIENGLHFSAHEKVWRFIFELAAQQNIQVFATTHSWDCIQAFQTAASEVGGDATLIRLHRDGRDTVPVVFQAEELAILTRGHIEVRW